MRGAKSRTLGAVIAVVTASSLLAACSGGAVKPSDSSANPSGSAAVNDTFVYAQNLEVVTDWDPATSYSNEGIVMPNVYETLTRYNPATQKVEPLLATAWQQSNGGKTWTFTLRDGVKFHDGAVLDAAMAKAALERTIKLQGGAAYIWGAVKTIDTPSANTLVFNLSYPAPIDLISSSSYGAYIYDEKAGGTADFKTFVATGKDGGSGPYTVSLWDKGHETEVKLAAYDGYWGGWTGTHYKNVEYRVVPEVTTAWQLLQSGQVSMVGRLNPQIFAQAQTTSGVATSVTSSFQNLLALYNTATGPMADVRVRKAVRDAIDYTGLVSALKGSVVEANGVVPKGLLGFNQNIVQRQNLVEAKALLAAAGYGPNGNKLSLTMTYAEGDADQQLFATLLTSSLQQLGVELKATPLQWSAQWDRGKSADTAKRQDIFVMYWYPDYADAYTWFINMFHSANPPFFNLAYWNNPVADKLIDSLPALTAVTPPLAQAAYTTLQKMIIDQDAVASVLYVQNYQRAYSSTVKNYVDNPAYPNVPFVYNMAPGA